MTEIKGLVLPGIERLTILVPRVSTVISLTVWMNFDIQRHVIGNALSGDFKNNDRFCFLSLLFWLCRFFFTLPMRKYKMNINEGSKIHYLHCICLIHKFRIQWDRYTNRAYWKPISRTMAVDRLSFFLHGMRANVYSSATSPG